ncbi:type 2 lanthipeptide synthetase LanM [Kitasatospora sp. NPDC087271]|uniref:type 2 lanthipeptide synthetase LanM n=1 Tax=Kitasatospora sp. NPDC087271 TaxID=3364067 RepID=UPI003807B822
MFRRRRATARAAGGAVAPNVHQVRRDIVATLLAGADPGRLVAVERTTGDGHRRGRSVAVLRFADGTRVVYKPRSLRVHGRFNELVGWFNARLGAPGLRVLALLERDGYGWVEFVAPGSCTAERQLERFYLRQGAWLALLYALDGTDLHFENLIACGDEPVLVDVETLFHPCVPADSQEDPAARALESSVYRSGLLPRLLLGDERAVDVSGLGGDAGRRSPVEGVDWAAGGTDEMRLIRRAGEITGAGNRPLHDGAEADPAGYIEALVAGFRAGYPPWPGASVPNSIATPGNGPCDHSDENQLFKLVPVFQASFTYDNALVITAFLQRGGTDDVAHATALGDSLLYAQAHDITPDSRIRASYEPDPFVRTPSGEPYVGGFSVYTGNMAWAGMALTRRYRDDVEPEDVQTWSYLATLDLSCAPAVDWAAGRMAATDGPYSGVGFSGKDTSGVWFEGTAHLLAAYQVRRAAAAPTAAVTRGTGAPPPQRPARRLRPGLRGRGPG